MSNLNIVEIKSKLVSLPISIWELTTRLNDLNLMNAALTKDLNVFQLQTMAEISEEKDETTGKPKFSNQNLRDAELLVRLGRNEVITALDISLNENKQKRLNIEAELQYNQNLFSGLKAITRLSQNDE